MRLLIGDCSRSSGAGLSPSTSIWTASYRLPFPDGLLSVSPHGVRRILYRQFRPRRFRWLVRLRENASTDGYSLLPFVERKAIFVHIPKAAGVSVCRGLFGNLGAAHTSVSQYRVVFTPRELAEFFKFAFVRNPWDRLHSAYYYLRSGGMNELDQKFAAAELSFDSFDEFVRRGLRRRGVRRYTHFVPQHRLVCLPGRRPLLDFVGRFENLERDYERVAEQIPDAGALRHDNRTAHRPDFRDEYSDATRSIVARMYSRDISMFGYRFE